MKIVIAIISAAAMIFLFFAPILPKLSIGGKLFDIERKEFVISYTHSVNKGRVRDYYIIDENKNIELYKTKFESYGAGIAEPENDEKFKINEDCMEICGINRTIDDLYLFVGVSANHKIEFDGNEIELKKIFEPRTSLKIEYKNISAFRYIISSLFIY